MRAGLLDYFKPEFINRLDDIVRFKALTREQISEIVDLQVARVIDRVAERGVEVTLTDEARTLLGDLGYDPTYGARPLRRVIQKQLTDRLALALLKGELREGDSVRVDAVDGELVLETVRRQIGGRGVDRGRAERTRHASLVPVGPAVEVTPRCLRPCFLLPSPCLHDEPMRSRRTCAFDG